MNSDFIRQALAKVGNPNILVNIISRRVRQLNSAGGTGSRPLIAGPEVVGLGAADIALLELIDDKLSFQLLEEAQKELPPGKKRKKS